MSRFPDSRRTEDRFILILVGLGLVILTLIVGLPILRLLIPPGEGIARGRVVEELSGRPISGATVLVRSYPELIALGDPRYWITGPQSSMAKAIGATDSSGVFEVPYTSLHRSVISVVAAGFVTRVDGPHPDSTVEIRLRSPSVTAQRIARGDLGFSVDSMSRSVLIDLDSTLVVKDRSRAEFEFVVHSVPKHEFTLRALGIAGLHSAEGETSGYGRETQCQAPEGPHARDFPVDSYDRFYFFSETKGHRRYGRLWIRTLVPEVSPNLGYVDISFTLNPTGTRGVCAEPPSGEEEVLAEIDSTRVSRQ